MRRYLLGPASIEVAEARCPARGVSGPAASTPLDPLAGRRFRLGWYLEKELPLVDGRPAPEMSDRRRAANDGRGPRRRRLMTRRRPSEIHRGVGPQQQRLRRVAVPRGRQRCRGRVHAERTVIDSCTGARLCAPSARQQRDRPRRSAEAGARLVAPAAPPCRRRAARPHARLHPTAARGRRPDGRRRVVHFLEAVENRSTGARAACHSRFATRAACSRRSCSSVRVAIGERSCRRDAAAVRPGAVAAGRRTSRIAA